MKNLKSKIEDRRTRIDEASGFGDTKKTAKPTYEEDFDSLVSASEIESEIETLDRAYKDAKSKSVKMAILKKKNKLQVKLKELKD
jgi:hypothetical protein